MSSNHIDDTKKDVSLKIEKILKPLGNPVRQELLLIIGQGPITYTEIYNELKLESGSFYWHIKKMNHLITQTEDKKYILSDLGLKAYELLLFDPESKTKYENPQWLDNIQQFIERFDDIPLWVIIQQILIVLVLLSTGFSVKNVVQIGSLPVVYSESNFSITFFLSLLSLLILSSFIISGTLIIDIKQNHVRQRSTYIKLFVHILFLNLGLFIPGIYSSLILIISNNSSIAFNGIILLILTFISTIISVVLLTALIQLTLGYKYENSLLIVLICYYPFILLSFFAQSL
ncbi:MAG: hypothetical protein ACW99A_06480 [Candidatus Kariarchaeaceae archaeon]|jgi:DNA-binding transcriptional ArsR family regulator